MSPRTREEPAATAGRVMGWPTVQTNDHSRENVDESQVPAPSHHRASTADDVKDKLLGCFAGFLVAGGAFAAAFLPLPIAANVWGQDVGATVGCGISALTQLAILVAIARYPRTPGAHVVHAMCSKMLVLMTVFTPVGVAIEKIPDRATATWSGVIAGVALLGAGMLALRAVPAGWRPSAYRASGVHAAASVGAAGMAIHHHADSGGADGADGGA